METSESSPFLIFWHSAMMVGGIIMLISGIVLYVFHKVRTAALTDPKAKYDYLQTREIRVYKLMFLCFAFSAMLFINLYGKGELTEMGIWFFVRLFISIAGGTLVGYVAYLILDYYYPTVLSRKLHALRYQPRMSAAGHKMRLLSEEEEDVHLEEGMQAEENVFSVDYDVWVDEASNEVKVEKYPGYLEALECNTCGFYTMRIAREEIVSHPSVSGPGELIKHYQCEYCGAVRATSYHISTKLPEDYSTQAQEGAFKSGIELVRVEIHSVDKGKEYFDFQNTRQAQQFLREYEKKDK